MNVHDPFYVAFDLDETLAEVYPIHPFLEDIEYLPVARIANVYRAFVRRIAETPSIGLLRPGLLPILQQLAQTPGFQGAVIYSNNGHLPSLHLVRDVIHESIAGHEVPFILDCIHYDHPIRSTDEEDRTGNKPKTWATLQRMLHHVQHSVKQEIPPHRVFFVDDLVHPDLQAALGPNYLQVSPYETIRPFEEWLDLYEAARADAGLSSPLRPPDRTRLKHASKIRLHRGYTGPDTFAEQMQRIFQGQRGQRNQRGGGKPTKQRKRRTRRKNHKTPRYPRE